jgi:hypothetical protein
VSEQQSPLLPDEEHRYRCGCPITLHQMLEPTPYGKQRRCWCICPIQHDHKYSATVDRSYTLGEVLTAGDGTHITEVADCT